MPICFKVSTMINVRLRQIINTEVSMAFKRLTSMMLFDFQINRILTYGQKACDEKDVFEASKKITDLNTWFNTWYELGEKAQNTGKYIYAGYYFRLAEFFLKKIDKKRDIVYDMSIKNFNAVIKYDSNVTTEFVPFEGSEMKVHIYHAKNEKGKIVLFGGYDSYIEEFYLAIKEICEYGYEVYSFEGPGQGLSLKKGLKFDNKWEKPLSKLLDYFNLTEVIVIGISWGGYFALRAAAFEKRIKKVVAYDILYDGFDCMTNPYPYLLKIVIKVLFFMRQRKIINRILIKIMNKSSVVDWAISNGEYITGAVSPYDFYMQLKKHTLKGIEEDIKCDVLLLAGSKDHYIPLNHYKKSMKKIVNARSLNGKIFTEQEGGEQHCQIGNHKLAIDYIMKWIENSEVFRATNI